MDSFRSLVERAKDNEYRRCAQEIYKRILAGLNKPAPFVKLKNGPISVENSYWVYIKNGMEPIFSIDMNFDENNKKYEDFCISFAPVDDPDGASFLWGNINIEVPKNELELVGGKLTAADQRKWVEWYKDRVFEEIYHMIDDYFETSGEHGNWQYPRAAYANSPVETNAKFQNVIRAMFDEYGTSLNKKNASELALGMYEYLYPIDYHLLTPENKKKLLKRVFAAID